MNTRENIVKDLDIGFLPEAAVSGPVLFQDDLRTFLLFNAVRMTDQGRRDAAGIGVIEFDQCWLTKFGYPNDEALGGHPLARNGLCAYGVFEVLSSSWIASTTEQNRVRFPATSDDTETRHFVFTFHDSTFECLARGLEPRLDNRPFRDIVKDVTSKLAGG